MGHQPADILILSNGPGELSTWVRPVVKALRSQLGDDREQIRISVVLSPCTHATGREDVMARNFPEVDRVQAAAHFIPFLLSGKTAENWDWRPHGLVIFLGGDQFFPIIFGRRFGYRTLIYAEWEARWQGWIDRFGVMNDKVLKTVNARYADKFAIVGDLMAEVGANASSKSHSSDETELIGLLPGSKINKLAQGVPLCLAIAEQLHQSRPQTRFVIPVAPTLELDYLARFANPDYNPVLPLVKGTTAELIRPADAPPVLRTASGLEVQLWTQSPAYELLSQCRLCLTTVGANTAELGSLAVPMVVLLPTNQLDAMRAWDGLPGLLVNLPLVGSGFARLMTLITSWIIQRTGRLFAWPNIWAGTEIVPELTGKLWPETVAAFTLDLLEHPEKLEQMRDRLRQLRGEPGAATRLAQLAEALLQED